MDIALELTDVEDGVSEQIIGDGLNAFNDKVVGYADRRPLIVLAKDPATGAVVGGIHGRTSLGLAFLDLVFLPDEARGSGAGTAMMRMAEEEARRRGCKSGFLLTISFQAPEFYRRLGWEEFGRSPCDPPGTSRVFFRKSFG